VAKEKPKPRPEAIVKAGVYWVKAEGLPRRLIETHLPAGPAAEETAKQLYLEGYDLRPKPGREFVVELAE